MSGSHRHKLRPRAAPPGVPYRAVPKQYQFGYQRSGMVEPTSLVWEMYLWVKYVLPVVANSLRKTEISDFYHGNPCRPGHVINTDPGLQITIRVVFQNCIY